MHLLLLYQVEDEEEEDEGGEEQDDDDEEEDEEGDDVSLKIHHVAVDTVSFCALIDAVLCKKTDIVITLTPWLSAINRITTKTSPHRNDKRHHKRPQRRWWVYSLSRSNGASFGRCCVFLLPNSHRKI